MSIVIRDVREHELDSVLALNNNAGLAILPLDAARLHLFYETVQSVEQRRKRRGATQREDRDRALEAGS